MITHLEIHINAVCVWMLTKLTQIVIAAHRCLACMHKEPKFAFQKTGVNRHFQSS